MRSQQLLMVGLVFVVYTRHRHTHQGHFDKYFPKAERELRFDIMRDRFHAGVNCIVDSYR